MIPPKCYSTKKDVNKWVHISETHPNQLDYPWFSKCPLNMGLEKPLRINSAGMSNLGGGGGVTHECHFWNLQPFQ